MFINTWPLVKVMCYCWTREPNKPLLSLVFKFHPNCWIFALSVDISLLVAERVPPGGMSADWVHAGLEYLTFPGCDTEHRSKLVMVLCHTESIPLYVCLYRQWCGPSAWTTRWAWGSGFVTVQPTCCEGPTTVSVSKWGFINWITGFSLIRLLASDSNKQSQL